MWSTLARGGLLAAGVAIIVFSYGFAPPLKAQQTALTVSPDLAAKGAWDAGTTYAKDDIVTARGSSWISLRANNLNKVPGQTQPSSAAYWQLFARGFNPTGPWSNVTKYQPDDLVTLSGQTYRAKITNTNKQPTNATNWELLAAKGAPGPNTGVSAGTQSTPAISFSGDGNTGIYSPGADKIALVEGGTLFLHNIGTSNTALGEAALPNANSGGNSAFGHFALHVNTADGNSAFGDGALGANTTGIGNVAVGQIALQSNTTANVNVAVGTSALGTVTTGGFNVGIGYLAGSSATNPVNSIFIGNTGASGDTTTTKIGSEGLQQTAFIAGIRGKTTGAADAVAVLIDSNGQLGTVSSSRRYKYDVASMADVSAMLSKLRPVTFRYKKPFEDGSKPIQYGLIAEEVAAVLPYLAVFNPDGAPETVKYHELPTFLLAGYQAQQKTIEAQAEKIEALSEDVRQQKDVNAALEARLRRLETSLPLAKAASLH